MSSIESESKPRSPFDGLPDPRFFYGNLSNREVLAALRFGIEGRRGLILLTGEAGTGKSAVLHELTCELNSKAACILVSDPHVRFTELLRLILRRLDVGAGADDESALIQCCKTAVRSQLEANRIVALAFDDAQHLPDEIIESLTRHFIGKGFDPDNNLLQIVLAGRPELRQRLFIPPLRSLDTQVEIECRLRPLNVKEVAAYIKHRLWAADQPAELFDHDAIEHIASYTDGRPGLVNAICSRARQLADQSYLDEITSDIIAGAARDLDLSNPGGINRETPPVNSKGHNAGAANLRSTTVVAWPFLDCNNDKDRRREFSLGEGNRRAILALSVLFLLGLPAAWLHGESAINYVREWGFKLDEMVGSSRQMPARATVEAETPRTTQDRASTQRPNADVPRQQSLEPQRSDVPVAKQEKSGELRASVPVERPSAGNLASSPLAANRGHWESSHKEPEQQRDLVKQISKAIEIRAIRGVYVSVTDGIAYLDGKVATSEQRNAAERAARGVPAVREIRNRIAIE
jgi:general secretion pathway protein A